MTESSYNLGTRVSEGEVYSSGMAYVAIPVDVDRDKYIGECFRTGTVSLFSEHNGFYNRVPIDRFSFSFIDFPTNPNEFGSTVSYIMDEVHKRPIITGIYFTTDELSDIVENQFKFKRKLGSNFVEITGSPKQNYLGLTVNADVGGEVYINVKSGSDGGIVRLNVEGQVQITATQDTVLKQYNKHTTQTVSINDANQFSTFEQTPTENNLQSDIIHIDTDEIRINGGDEPIILGNKWKQFMNDFIQEVGNSTVSTAIGQQPLLNKQQIIDYQNKLDALLSQISFLDS